MSQLRVIITGIGGFVGPYLARTLLSHGTKVFGLIQEGVDPNPPPALDKEEFSGIDFFPFDLSNRDSIDRILELTQPDIIFHLAGFSSVRDSFREPTQTYKANCLGTENLLESLRKIRPTCKFFFTGSSEEYGLQISSHSHYQWAIKTFRTVFPPPDRIPELPVNENNPLRPMSPYAVSKVYGDFLARTYSASFGINSIITRTFNHEGAGRGEGFVTSSIVRQCVDLALGNTDHIMIGNVCAFRDWSHVTDIVEGYRILAENGSMGEVYVLGSRRMNSVLTYLLLGLSEVGYSVEGIETLHGDKHIEAPMEIDNHSFIGLEFEKLRIDHLMLEMGLSYELQDGGLKLLTRRGEVKVIFDPERYRPADIPLLISDTAKAEKLGFKITRSLRDIVKDQVKYYQKLQPTKSC